MRKHLLSTFTADCCGKHTQPFALAAIALACLCLCSCKEIGNSFMEASNSLRSGGSYYTSPAPQYKSWQETQLENDYRFYTDIHNQEMDRVNKALYGPY